jgi:UDP-galactopyranose mutase
MNVLGMSQAILNHSMNMKNHYDYLVVGSGLFGATFAYRANQAGKHCLVIDKRPQLGGNLYCKKLEGINVHQYGAHIFHTSNKQVWQFVNSLVEFNRYTNSPVANYRGKLFNLPFNMNTFYQMWGVTTPEEAQAKLEEEKNEMRDKLDKLNVKEPRNLEEQAQLLIGKSIYEALIKGYTEKQWGRKCTELPAFIIRRLPVRLVFDNNYFNDAYQGIPIGGYNMLIKKLLEGSDSVTDCDFFDLRQVDGDGKLIKNIKLQGMDITFERLVYTGQIDEFFDYRLGKLNFRTVRFDTEVKDMPNYQGTAVVNYTDAAVPYTRVIEHKHFESFGQAVYDNPKTVISREYSTEWKDGLEPYYPVNDETNNSLAEKYRALATSQPDVIFGGRLAEYKYYDMAPIIEKVLTMEIPRL